MRVLILTFVVCWAVMSGGASAAYNSAVDALLDQARSHLDEGDYERADLVAQRIVRIDPEDSRGWGLMADVRSAQGDEKAAAEYRSRERLARAQADGETTENPVVVFSSPESEMPRAPNTESAYNDNVQSDSAQREDSELQTTQDYQRQQSTANANTVRREATDNSARPQVGGWSQSEVSSEASSEARKNSNVYESGGGTTGGGYRTENTEVAANTTQRRYSEDQSKRQRLNNVFAKSEAYAKSSARTRPQAQKYHYTAKQRSRLDRIRRSHQQSVAKLQRKIFRNDSSRHYQHDDADNLPVRYRPDGSGRTSNNHNRSAASLVPPGYYPPAGYCRIWYYDVAPEDQPPPGDCRYLRSKLPVGARLLKGT